MRDRKKGTAGNGRMRSDALLAWVGRYWQETAAFLSLEGLLLFWQIWHRGQFASPLLYDLTVAGLLLFCVFFLAFFVLTIRKWGQRLAAPLKEAVGKALYRLSRRLMETAGKLMERFSRGYDNTVGGQTRIVFEFSGDKGAGKRKRRVPWRHLETERERVRRLYAEVVEDGLRHGVRLYPSDTPQGVERKLMPQDEAEAEILKIYGRCRYDERMEIPEGKGEQLRGKWKKG